LFQQRTARLNLLFSDVSFAVVGFSNDVSTHYLVKAEAHPLVKPNLAEKRLLKVVKLAQQHDKYTNAAREDDFLTLFSSSLFLTLT